MEQKLIDAVRNQLGEDEEEVNQTLEDVSNHGAGGGYGGFIYHSDTVKFFEDNKVEIVALVKEMSEEFGEKPMAFVASFQCLKGEDQEEDIAHALYGNLEKDDVVIPNALSWFALEEVARNYVDTQ
jgi:hypothetical protein